jgi:hypothetical protein
MSQNETAASGSRYFTMIAGGIQLSG